MAGSIPDEAIGFFNWRNPSSRSMALRSTQPLIEMSTRNLLGPARKIDNLTVIFEPIVWTLENVRASTSYNPMGLHGLLQG
jgi:hypothetical protein